MSREKKDIKGQCFYRYLVLEFDSMRKGHAYWKCRCDCGTIKVVRGASLTNGASKSCGCLKIEKTIERNKQGNSEETRQKIKDNHADINKEKNPRYNSNLTDEDRQDRRLILGYNDWRIAVYERDNYTCQCCGKRGGKLAAHHLESYRDNLELRTSLENGITLCAEDEDCHGNFHHQYGYGNNNRGQFEEFLRVQKENRDVEK